MTETIHTKKLTPGHSRTQDLWQAGIDTSERPCIWMQAGVVAKKQCNHYYDCTTCKYDTAMEKQAAAGRHISWQDAMRKRDSKSRACRHTLTGRMDHRTCPMNYNCSRCDFDQLFEETLAPGTAGKMSEMTDIKGFKLAKGHFFHSGHAWATIESGGFMRVGMDDFAFRVLGGPDGFDLPLTGQELNQDRPCWGIKRNRNIADVLSPVNGVITKVNPNVAATPDLAARMPYEDGWLFTVHNSDLKKAVKNLMADQESEPWMEGEITALERMIEDVAGPLSADGGLLIRDVYGNLPTLGWSRLTRRFLGT